MLTSFIAKFPKDFPRCTIVKRDGYTDYRRVNAGKLLDWLHKHGRSPLTTADIAPALATIDHLERGVT